MGPNDEMGITHRGGCVLRGAGARRPRCFRRCRQRPRSGGTASAGTPHLVAIDTLAVVARGRVAWDPLAELALGLDAAGEWAFTMP